MNPFDVRSTEQERPLLGARYELRREIGRGGMAVVYLARDVKLARDVAVKVLLGDLVMGSGVDRFRREISVVSKLSHPHIVAIDDFGEANGHPFYVMPFVAGETLRVRLERERQLPIDQVLRITSAVSAALEHAHRHDVIHRDVKPENILIQDGEALLADFGIARAIAADDASALTRTGVTLGTPAYMSPEQGVGDPSLDARSDVYSLGCVMYEMLTGAPPFTGSPSQIVARHQLDAPTSLSILRPGVPAGLERIVMRALAKTPADRFASAGDLLVALTSADASTPGSTAAGRVPRQARSLRIVAVTAAIVVIAIASWAVWRGGVAARDERPADADPNHIAILYFDDRTPDGRGRLLADGLTEALIEELSAVRQLRVISKNGVAPYKGSAVAPDSLRRALKVGTLVSGTVRDDQGQIRVDVSLVDALTGDDLGAEHVTRPRGQLIALERDLATTVAMALRRKLGGEMARRSRPPGARDSRAWEQLQGARETLATVDSVLAIGGVEAGGRQLARADSEFAIAASLDPRWSAPVVARGWIAHRKVLVLGFASGDLAKISSWLDEARRYAEQALGLTPEDPDALELRATATYFQWMYNLGGGERSPDRLIANAETDFRAAVRANPLQATAWNGLSHLLNNKGQTAEAKMAAYQAYESDPYLRDIDKTIWRLFVNSLDLGTHSEAERWCAVGRQRIPGHFRFAECRLWLFAMLGQTPSVDSIWAAYRELARLSPPSLKRINQSKGGMIAALGLVRAGLPDSARRLAVRSRATVDVDRALELVKIEAELRAQLGDVDEAIDLLARFYAANPQQRALAANDETWWWDPLKNDPRYTAIIRHP